MKVKDPHFILEKIEKYIQEDIRPSRIRDIVEIEQWKYMETDMEQRIDDAYLTDYDDSGWTDFKLWDTWGGYDKVAWFRTEITVPEHFCGKQLAVRLLPGPRDGGDCTAEALLYINGKPVQGMDIWHEEALLEEGYCKKGSLKLALKAWSGVLVPPKFRTFKLAQLFWLDTKVERFCYVADTVRRCALLLDENDLRRIRLTRLLNNTFRKINFLNFKEEEYYQSVYEALDFINSELCKLAEIEEIKPIVYGVGHSHIDMAWLWRLCATREKASRTFSTVLNLMKQYPEYRFMHSSPQLYQFLKEDYPEIYAEVKERIQEGRWEITGGMWVEPDTNVPSGEALVRQFVYGKSFIREEFGKETNLVWLPDVFGYSGALPQIMKKSGMKYFMTTKISWNQYNHFPYDTFLWKGIDGSEIFTHFITTPEDGSWFYTYNGHMDPEEVTGVWKNYKDKDKNDELLIAYGWGDGGGGPTREMLEQSSVMKNIPGIPRVELCGAEDYFEKIYQHTDHSSLGTWEGELYFELHRGTYTSQAATKRYNRKSEILLHNIEALSVLRDQSTGQSLYPETELRGMWERVLLNQFHDILPGSSIRQVYEDTTKDYEEIREKGQKLLREAAADLAEKGAVAEPSVYFYNTTGLTRSDYALIPYGGQITENTRFIDREGRILGDAAEKGIRVYVEEVPAYGYKTLELAKPESGEKQNRETGKSERNALSGQRKLQAITVEGDKITTPFYEMILSGNGEISSLYDLENGRRVDCGKPMNVFAAYEDKPQRFDAWDIDVYYKEKPYQPFELVKREVIKEAEAVIVRQSYRFNKSVLWQDMILYEKSRRIDFVSEADWQEEQVLLKVYFPVEVHSKEATYEIQFGTITRPTTVNTEWDFARFEVSGHRFADLSEGGYGVSILNDCKYGYDIQGNVLGLSLIKSAVRPDETADRGRHEFTYSLLPHKGNAQNTEIMREALNLNLPFLTAETAGKGTGDHFQEYSFVQTDCDHVLIDTIKRAEDGNGLILRLYEYQNRSNSEVTLIFGRKVRKVVETNLCEEGETEVVLSENRIQFGVDCYEIKTFRVFL